jgi:hypothetical protein
MKNRTPIGVGAVTASRPLELPQFDFEGTCILQIFILQVFQNYQKKNAIMIELKL